MSEIKEVKPKKKKKLSKSAIVIIVGLSIIAIPCIIFVAILGISALQTGSPREGSRFTNDLVNEITSDNVSEIENDLKSISNVESVEAKVSEGQFKVFIDTNDSLTSEQVDEVVKEAYNRVIAKLPISTYFTKTDTAKMYDLQINVYTSAEGNVDRQYKLLHKNSAEEQFQIDDLAHPKDAELVKELEGKATENTETESAEEEEKPTE